MCHALNLSLSANDGVEQSFGSSLCQVCSVFVEYRRLVPGLLLGRSRFDIALRSIRFLLFVIIVFVILFLDVSVSVGHFVVGV